MKDQRGHAKATRIHPRNSHWKFRPSPTNIPQNRQNATTAHERRSLDIDVVKCDAISRDNLLVCAVNSATAERRRHFTSQSSFYGRVKSVPMTGKAMIPKAKDKVYSNPNPPTRTSS